MPVARLPDGRGELITLASSSVKSVNKASVNANNVREDGGFVTIKTGVNPVWIVSGKGALVSVKPTAGNPQPGFPLDPSTMYTFAVNYDEFVALIEM